MELYERIRKDSREEGLGIRALAARHHVHRRDVREALASATPAQRKVPERDAPAIGPWTTVIRAWLVADRSVPRKQRHTARRVYQRLVAEYGADAAESTVRAHVAEVNFEFDNTLRVVTVPQTHGPGEEAEVDFGEFVAYLDGVLVKCWMFCMRLSPRGGASTWPSPTRPRSASWRATYWPSTPLGPCPAGSARKMFRGTFS